MGSPVDDALDRLASIGWLSPQEAQDLATVRQRLAEQDTDIQRLREERDAARGWTRREHDRAEAAEAEKRQLRKGLREIDKLDGRYHDLNTARWMARKTLDSLAGPSADAARVPAGEPSDG